MKRLFYFLVLLLLVSCQASHKTTCYQSGIITVKNGKLTFTADNKPVLMNDTVIHGYSVFFVAVKKVKDY